jgi:hypothetical protein
MSGSFSVFDSVVAELLTWLQPSSALDVGTGAGKYGHMLTRAAPQCRRVGIEAEATYIERFGLNDIYQQVHCGSAADWQATALDSRFDLAIVGDCLTHMSKSAGQDLLNFLAYRSAYTLIVAPEFIVQSAADSAAGLPTQERRSVWSERDLGWHDLWAWDNCRTVSFFLLRGYLPSPMPLNQLVDRVNSSSLPIHEFFDRQSVVRPARLRLVSQGRETSYRPA